eukprot:scaffold1160_cov95-Cylindrotheca_fusiformis.AAC.4
MKAISSKYSPLDEDAALKKQGKDVWKSGLKSIVEVHQSSESPMDDTSKRKVEIMRKEDDVGGTVDEGEIIQGSFDRNDSLGATQPPLPDHHEDWYPEAEAMGGGSSPRTSDLIIQSGDTEDNDPSDVLINAIPVDEIEELGAPAIPQEMVSAVVMSEDDKGTRGIWSIFQNRQVACIVVLFVIISVSLAAGLSRSDDTKTADDAKRASDAAPSFPPTAATSLLADLLRDSVGDTMPWENKTTPQYKALDWLTNDDVWLAASLKDGNYSIPIHVLRERYALVVLCMAWGDREWATKYAMLDETTSSCEWSIEEFCLPENDFCLPKGAVCDDDGFISALHSFGLDEATGEIPAELFLLSSLEYLLLDGNSLHGTIPTELFQLPKLQLLFLSGNKLSGSIPTEAGLAANLRNLDLDGNDITGTLDNVVNPRLKNLYLSGNLLEGTIPQDIGTMTMLETLVVNNNELSGSIPREIGLAANLRNLDLGQNLITGTLDNVVNPRLKNLDLSGNLLEGTIPQDFGIMTMLEILWLPSNKLSGPLPPTLEDLHRLDILRLENNPSLTGAVPATLSSLNVSVLNLQGTNLTNLEVFCSNPPPEYFMIGPPANKAVRKNLTKSVEVACSSNSPSLHFFGDCEKSQNVQGVLLIIGMMLNQETNPSELAQHGYPRPMKASKTSTYRAYFRIDYEYLVCSLRYTGWSFLIPRDCNLCRNVIFFV